MSQTASKIVDVMYLKNEDGKVFEFKGPKFNKLKKEIKAGRGGAEVCNLMESGYVSFVCAVGEEEVDAIGLEELNAGYFA
jgi:hypothetical protein